MWMSVTCILWKGVSMQCKDPMIFKLTYIEEVIANLTTRLEEQEQQQEVIANLTRRLEQQEEQQEVIANLTMRLGQQEAMLEQLEAVIAKQVGTC